MMMMIPATKILALISRSSLPLMDGAVDALNPVLGPAPFAPPCNSWIVGVTEIFFDIYGFNVSRYVNSMI